MEKEGKGSKHQSPNDLDQKNPDKDIQKGFMSELNITRNSQQQKTSITDEVVTTHSTSKQKLA